MDLRNRMGDKYLNGALVCKTKRETFDKVTDEDLMIRFVSDERMTPTSEVYFFNYCMSVL